MAKQNKQAATPTLAAQAAVVVAQAAVVQAAQRKPLGISHSAHGKKLVALAGMQGTLSTQHITLLTANAQCATWQAALAALHALHGQPCAALLTLPSSTMLTGHATGKGTFAAGQTTGNWFNYKCSTGKGNVQAVA
jgi:hypothetical protein